MRYNKIPNEAKWYIRCVKVLIYFIIVTFLYILKIVIIRFFPLEKYIPFNIDISLIFKIVVTIVTSIMCILIIFLPRLIHKNYGFYTDKYFFKIKSGVVFKTISIVLVKDVSKISLKKKMIGRIFGISSITISTSAGNIKINYLDNKKREALFNYITYAMKKYGEKNV